MSEESLSSPFASGISSSAGMVDGVVQRSCRGAQITLPVCMCCLCSSVHRRTQ